MTNGHGWQLLDWRIICWTVILCQNFNVININIDSLIEVWVRLLSLLLTYLVIDILQLVSTSSMFHFLWVEIWWHASNPHSYIVPRELPQEQPWIILCKKGKIIFYPLTLFSSFKNKIATPSHPSRVPNVPMDSCHYKTYQPLFDAILPILDINSLDAHSSLL